MKSKIMAAVLAVLLCGCSVPAAELIPTVSVEAVTLNPTQYVSPVPTSTPSPTPTPSPIPTPTPITQDLAGYKIGIDPGHQRYGNYDTESVSPYYNSQKTKCSGGAVCVDSRLNEYEFNLIMAFLLRDALIARGAEVYLTRDKSRVDISNQERAKAVNEAGCDLWIRIHANSSTDNEKRGISTLTPKIRAVSTYLYTESQRLSGLIQKQITAQTGAYDLGLSYRGDITGFNWSRIPVALVECGYMSNSEDDILLNDEHYQSLLVQGLLDGIVMYLAGEEFPIEYEYNP